MSLLNRRMMMTNVDNGGSEMDKWETIIDYTHSGDSVINKIFTTGDDGQPFQLKKVSVFVAMAPPTDSTVTQRIPFTIYPCNRTKYGVDIGQTPRFGGKTLYGRVFFEQLDYGLYPTIAVGSANEDSVRMILGEVRPMYGINTVDLNTGLIDSPPDICTSVIAGSHYLKAVTAGTRIIIKGVRI